MLSAKALIVAQVQQSLHLVMTSTTTPLARPYAPLLLKSPWLKSSSITPIPSNLLHLKLSALLLARSALRLRWGVLEAARAAARSTIPFGTRAEKGDGRGEGSSVSSEEEERRRGGGREEVEEEEEMERERLLGRGWGVVVGAARRVSRRAAA